MLIPAPPRFPRKRNRTKARVTWQPTPPVVGPVLVSAAYDQGADVVLTFDRAIDASAFDPASLSLFDGPAGFQYGADGEMTVLSPTSVLITVVGVADWTGTGVTLDVTSANGIVAADDGSTWAGAGSIPLPYP